MDFIIPEIMLKQDERNSVMISYTADSSHFGLKINKSWDDEFTKLPIMDIDNHKEYNIKLDIRNMVEK
jgi:hypothetical protein